MIGNRVWCRAYGRCRRGLRVCCRQVCARGRCHGRCFGEWAHEIRDDPLALAHQSVQCANQHRRSRVNVDRLNDPDAILIALMDTHSLDREKFGQVTGILSRRPGLRHHGFRFGQADPLAFCRLMALSAVCAARAGRLRQGCHRRRAISVAFRGQRPRHRGIPPAFHQRMPEPELRQSRQLFLPWPHPVRVQHTTEHRIPFRHEQMPVQFVPADPRLSVLNDDAAVQVESEFRGDVAQDAVQLRTADRGFRRNLEMPDSVALASSRGVLLHERQVVGTAGQHLDRLVCRPGEDVAHEPGQLQCGQEASRLDDHRRPARRPARSTRRSSASVLRLTAAISRAAAFRASSCAGPSGERRARRSMFSVRAS